MGLGWLAAVVGGDTIIFVDLLPFFSPPVSFFSLLSPEEVLFFVGGFFVLAFCGRPVAGRAGRGGGI